MIIQCEIPSDLIKTNNNLMKAHDKFPSICEMKIKGIHKSTKKCWSEFN